MPTHSVVQGPKPPENHRLDRIGWLRAAVLGANDGIVTIASILLGMIAARADLGDFLIAGVASLVAGALSMAVGEYVSVSSQADTEQADLQRERYELQHYPEHELQELAHIYEARGLTPALAHEVAVQLTAHDALGAHARDELGIATHMRARPLQAAIYSALSFAVGGGMPLISALGLSGHLTTEALWMVVMGSSLLLLMFFGWFAAYAGAANAKRSVTRVVLGGAIAMALTTGVGMGFGVAA